ncbi:hypothetical protein LY76DRAFT_298564 [Colletotrichum caudatum]|nr:hypothetical protein LY76DRAFT_298564 [Colletotrichum caudatum]
MLVWLTTCHTSQPDEVNWTKVSETKRTHSIAGRLAPARVHAQASMPLSSSFRLETLLCCLRSSGHATWSFLEPWFLCRSQPLVSFPRHIGTSSPSRRWASIFPSPPSKHCFLPDSHVTGSWILTRNPSKLGKMAFRGVWLPVTGEWMAVMRAGFPICFLRQFGFLRQKSGALHRLLGQREDRRTDGQTDDIR